jgi:hypothetical protein
MNTTTRAASMRLTLMTLGVILCMASTAAADLNLMTYQCRLTDEVGTPLTEPVFMVFSIYNAAVGGSELWTEDAVEVTPDAEGLISVTLGQEMPLDPVFSTFYWSNHWLEIKLQYPSEEITLSPRRPIHGVPMAILANDSHHLGGYTSAHYAEAAHLHDDRYTTHLALTVSDGTPPNIGSNLVNWDNLTGVPAGLADGVDDTGGTVSLDDAYDAGGAGAGRLVTVDSGPIELDGGGLIVHGDTELNGHLQANAAITIGDPGLYGELTVDGDYPINFHAGQSGTNAVDLPDDAIDNTEIFDEPGLSRGRVYLNSFGTEQTTMTDLCTTTITIPASGYILLMATCGLQVNAPSGGNVRVYHQIDETAGGDYSTSAQLEGSSAHPSGLTFGTLHCNRAYGKTAGTYTFRYEAKSAGTEGNMTFTNASITAVYFPTSYGSVAGYFAGDAMSSASIDPATRR